MLHPWGASLDSLSYFARHDTCRRAVRPGDGKRTEDEFHVLAGKRAGSAQMLTNQHAITEQALMHGPSKTLSRAAMYGQIGRWEITGEQFYLFRHNPIRRCQT
jgi:hypothetical protein